MVLLTTMEMDAVDALLQLQYSHKLHSSQNILQEIEYYDYRPDNEMRSDTLVYESLNSVQQCATEPNEPEVYQLMVTDERNSSIDAKVEVSIPTSSLSKKCSTKRKHSTDSDDEESAVTSTDNPKRRFVSCSTPLPTSGNGPLKKTCDAATQTDETELSQIPAEKKEELVKYLNLLYAKYMKVFRELLKNSEDLNIKPEPESSETVVCDKESNTQENGVEDTWNNSDIDVKDVHRKPKCKALLVTKVTAHGRNSVNQNSESDMVAIGSGYARVPARLLNNLDWNSPSMVTRQLLLAVFSRETLATHSLTGKRSPAFPDKPTKKCLDPKSINDIVITVSRGCGVSKTEVRNFITIKCADEAKLSRKRETSESLSLDDQENVPPSRADEAKFCFKRETSDSLSLSPEDQENVPPSPESCKSSIGSG